MKKISKYLNEKNLTESINKNFEMNKKNLNEMIILKKFKMNKKNLL